MTQPCVRVAEPQAWPGPLRVPRPPWNRVAGSPKMGRGRSDPSLAFRPSRTLLCGRTPLTEKLSHQRCWSQASRTTLTRDCGSQERVRGLGHEARGTARRAEAAPDAPTPAAAPAPAPAGEDAARLFRRAVSAGAALADLRSFLPPQPSAPVK